MCACDWNFRCERCKATPWERYLVEGDEPTREEREQAEAYRVWRETQGILPVGRAW